MAPRQVLLLYLPLHQLLPALPVEIAIAHGPMVVAAVEAAMEASAGLFAVLRLAIVLGRMEALLVAMTTEALAGTSAVVTDLDQHQLLLALLALRRLVLNGAPQLRTSWSHMAPLN